MTLKLPMSSAFSLVLILILAAPAQIIAQIRRQTPPRVQTPPPARTTKPAPTFDTLLAADTYKLYGEVRSVGQLIRSNSINEILEPIMKLASPPKGFRTLVKWLNTHADEVTTSRLLLAGWPSRGALPDILMAIEFASPEEAAKFKQKLNEFLPKLLPAPSPESSPSPGSSPSTESSPQPAKTEPPGPPYHLRQAGSLILITPTPLKLARLRPAGSKLLSEDVNFRIARNRFNSESIFVFIDVAAIEKEEKEQQKKYEEQHKEAIAAMEKDREELEKAKAELEKTLEEEEIEMPPPEEKAPVDGHVGMGVKAPEDPISQMSRADQLTLTLMSLALFSATYTPEESNWPEAIGLAISLEGESFDVRALLVNAPGEKSDPLPFFPLLNPGPALLPESPNILPADTEMLLTMSLDLGRIYTAFSKPTPFMTIGDKPPGETPPVESPVQQLEKRLKINIKDELLPLIGSEVVFSMPLTGFDLLQPPRPSASPSPSPSPSSSPSPSPNPSTEAPDQTKTTRGPALLLSLKDKEAMRTLLPKIVEGVAFKGANAFASTERREDTELVSYANLLSYAFIGNFLVLSTDPATTRHIVDSYLKQQTLAGDPQFKNYTRWQPRSVQAQLYISPALMESYRTWVQQPNNAMEDQLRQMLTRLTIMPQPVTYSLSNEGFGPLHELHLPKNLVLMFIASIAGSPKSVVVEDKPPTSNPTGSNPN
jgi:Protein of unknown function (DUF3352)